MTAFPESGRPVPTSAIARSELFAGFDSAELAAALGALSASRRRYAKGAWILRAGSITERMGFVEEGSVIIERIEPDGRRTTLDTARLKDEISRHFHVDARNVHTMIVGEHGDSEVPLWSITNIAGVPLVNFCEAVGGCGDHAAAMNDFYVSVRDSAYRIIERKGATYYGVAMAVARIATCIVNDEHSVLPVSVALHGQYGIEGVNLSVPSVLGAHGVERILEIPLSGKELDALRKSADTLRSLTAAPAP